MHVIVSFGKINHILKGLSLLRKETPLFLLFGSFGYMGGITGQNWFTSGKKKK
jgi:hypothetical protein